MSFYPKMIALDLDGTLLNSSSQLTPRCRDTLRRAMSRGIKVIVATGRMCSSALPIINDIGTDSPCVFYNGGVIKYPVSGKTAFKKELRPDITGDIINFFHDKGWYLQRYSDDVLYVVDDTDKRCLLYEGIAKVKAVPLGEKFWDFRGVATKLLGISSDPENYKMMYDEVCKNFSERLYIATSWNSFVEMVDPGVNKARAVAAVAGLMGINRSDVLVMGDASNDKEMIAWAGHGVAMANGSESARLAADEIAPDNDHDGVAVIAERYLREEKSA